eukprot:1059487_1
MQSMAYRSSVASSPGVSSHIPHNKRPVLLRVCHETIPINSHPKSIQSPPATQRHPAATSTTITPHTMQQNKRQCNSHEANEIWLFSSHEANEIWQTQRCIPSCIRYKMMILFVILTKSLFDHKYQSSWMCVCSLCSAWFRLFGDCGFVLLMDKRFKYVFQSKAKIQWE